MVLKVCEIINNKKVICMDLNNKGKNDRKLTNPTTKCTYNHFLANLVFLSEYDKDLYHRVDELSRMIENGTYEREISFRVYYGRWRF